MTTPANDDRRIRLVENSRQRQLLSGSHHVSASIALCAGAVKARSRARRARSAQRTEALTAPVHRATMLHVMALPLCPMDKPLSRHGPQRRIVNCGSDE